MNWRGWGGRGGVPVDEKALLASYHKKRSHQVQSSTLFPHCPGWEGSRDESKHPPCHSSSLLDPMALASPHDSSIGSRASKWCGKEGCCAQQFLVKGNCQVWSSTSFPHLPPTLSLAQLVAVVGGRGAYLVPLQGLCSRQYGCNSPVFPTILYYICTVIKLPMQNFPMQELGKDLSAFLFRNQCWKTEYNSRGFHQWITP